MNCVRMLEKPKENMQVQGEHLNLSVADRKVPVYQQVYISCCEA